jgi:hypothetical protein
MDLVLVRERPDRHLFITGMAAAGARDDRRHVHGTRGCIMAKFLTIGNGTARDTTAPSQPYEIAAHEQDARLRGEGAEIGIAGTPVQVRNYDAAGVVTERGPFMNSSLPVAGFAVIEAASMAEAVEIASRTPCAVAHGVAEVWPFEQAP